MTDIVPPRYLLAGSIVTIPTKNYLGLATHFAIVSNGIGIDGQPIVVANSDETQGPAEWLWSNFTQGRPYKDAYYPSGLLPAAVLQNAYSMFGSSYNLLSWNCEHFANACHGLPAISKQVNTVAMLAAMGGLALALARAT